MTESENVLVPRCDQAVDTIVGRSLLRGTAANISADLSELRRRRLKARMENPAAYTAGDILESSKGYKYKTGSCEGTSYMTVDDFMRLRQDMSAGNNPRRTMVSILSAIKADEEICTEKRPAAPYAYAECTAPGVLSDRAPVFSGNTEAEYHVVRPDRRSLLPAKLKRFLAKATESKLSVRSVVDKKHVSSSIATVSIAAVLALVLIFPVTMSVLIHNSRTEISKLDTEIAAAEKTVTQLEIELDEKNDREMLETLAVTEYGMVKIDRRQFSVLKIDDNTVESIEKEKSGGAVPALLSALGLRSDD